MRKQFTVAALLMLLFAGLGSSALLTRALAQPKSLTAIQQEKLIGPKPTPHWYWRWLQWRLGEGYAKSHPLGPNLRPKQVPGRIPTWAWQRMHLFLLARKQRDLANAGNNKHHGHATTSSSTTTSATTTTTTSTTTSGTTTTSSGSTTYDQAIAYTQTRPAFTPTRTIDVSSATELDNALANLQGGDLVQATASFTVAGMTSVSKRLSSPAVVNLTGVSFVYSGGANYPAFDVSDSSNIRFYGGDLSTADTGGVCLNLMADTYITWWGFTAHDCGSTGLRMMTGNPSYSSSGPVSHNDVEGEIWKFGQNTQWSTHNEPCTGLHGANIADGNYFPVSDNRVALYVHDSTCEGAGISFGSSQSTNIPSNNTIILQCSNLSYVSTLQTGGNCYQTWGYGNQNTDLKYVQADNLQGHAYFAGGLYNKPNSYLSSDTTEYGRASNTNQNPRYATDPVWDPTGGAVFQDVRPAP